MLFESKIINLGLLFARILYFLRKQPNRARDKAIHPPDVSLSVTADNAIRMRTERPVYYYRPGTGRD